jgi:Ulp1 family protease
LFYRIQWHDIRSNYDSLFTVVNYRGNHWCMLLISLETCEFTFIDPVKKNVRLADKVFANWKNYISSFNVDIDDINSTWIVKEYSHSFQRDSFNCGIYCLLFLELLLENPSRNDLLIAFEDSIESFLIEKRNSIHEYFTKNNL